MARKKKGLFVDIGGLPVDLNAGMIEAVTNPPPGFVSGRRFAGTDIGARIRGIDWFSHCGEPIALELSMPIRQLKDWADAIRSCRAPRWGDVQLEAQNQLTLWLHLNDRQNYQRWNSIVAEHKKQRIGPLMRNTLNPLLKKIAPLAAASLEASIMWDLLVALMEDSYRPSGHDSYFFHELLEVYESGHFPCGWRGRWPKGELFVY